MSKTHPGLPPVPPRQTTCFSVGLFAMVALASTLTAVPAGAEPKPRSEPSWRLTVSRRAFTTPFPLVSGKPDEEGHLGPSVLNDTLEAIKKQYPGCQILRPDPNPDLPQDLTNIGEHHVGVIVYRFTKNAEPRFAQRAIIQANDQLYYLVALTTPGRKDMPKPGEEEVDDPAERQACETFRAVLDSVRLLDRDKIRLDQTQRIIRTRSWLTNLTPAKLNSILVPEQWNLILRDGKNVGWQYIVEQPDRKAAQDGIKVGIRTRITAGGKDKLYPLEESEAWMFTTIDRNHEDWSKQTAIDDGIPHTSDHPWKKFTEIGSSDLKVKRTAVVAPRLDPEHPGRELPMNPADAYRRGEPGDGGQPWVETRSSQELNVRFAGSVTDIDPVIRPLPPFYLPQAMASMLPRLMDPREPKEYAIYCYMSDMHEVMLRYIDVGVEQEVNFAGRNMRAVPIRDRVGYEGAPTIHYVDSKGLYLGSYRGPAARVTPAPRPPAARGGAKPVVGPQDPGAKVVLGQEFVSPSGGISLCPPNNAKALREVGKDDIVEFVEGTPDAPAKETSISIISSDAKSVLDIWPDASLQRPTEVQAAAADSSPRGAPLVNPVTPGR